jgi:hypothetical protein
MMKLVSAWHDTRASSSRIYAQIHHPYADPAILFGHAVPQQAVVGQGGHQPGMDRRRLISLFGDGRNLVLGQPPHLLLQLRLFLGECEVHGNS